MYCVKFDYFTQRSVQSSHGKSNKWPKYSTRESCKNYSMVHLLEKAKNLLAHYTKLATKLRSNSGKVSQVQIGEMPVWSRSKISYTSSWCHCMKGVKRHLYTNFRPRSQTPLYFERERGFSRNRVVKVWTASPFTYSGFVHWHLVSS